MNHTARWLLCLLVLTSTAAFADSLDSINPSSFPSFILEQEATLQGTNLFGNLNGAPDAAHQETLLASTEVQVSGPAGTFVEGLNFASRSGTNTDAIIMAIPDPTLLVEGHYSVTVIAHDTDGDRFIGPVFYDVVPQVVPPQPPLLAIPENVFAEATSASGANVSFFVGGFSFVDPPPAPQPGASTPYSGTPIALLIENVATIRAGRAERDDDGLIAALAALMANDALEPAFIALALAMPAELNPAHTK